MSLSRLISEIPRKFNSDKHFDDVNLIKKIQSSKSEKVFLTEFMFQVC
jgi:hypothetical protein